MGIIVYLFFLSLFLMTCFLLTALVIDKNLDESHPFKKWLRKHIVAPNPEDDIKK